MDEHVTDLLPAYALDCLEEAETEQVAAHLASCPACRAEMQEYQAVTERLPLAVAPVEPPPGLKGSLMERIERAERERQAMPKRIPGRTWAQRVGNVFQSFSPVWALASLVVIVALIGSNLVLLNRLATANERPFSTVRLSGAETAPGASAILVVSSNREYGTLVVEHMPVLNPEQQYQLWLTKDGQRVSGGVFSVHKNGYGAMVVYAPEPLGSYQRFGVTIEPYGGSPGPTGERVLSGSF